MRLWIRYSSFGNKEESALSGWIPARGAEEKSITDLYSSGDSVALSDASMRLVRLVHYLVVQVIGRIHLVSSDVSFVVCLLSLGGGTFKLNHTFQSDISLNGAISRKKVSAPPRFELGSQEPESCMLPLHHRALHSKVTWNVKNFTQNVNWTMIYNVHN